jgi:hypothetical protein
MLTVEALDRAQPGLPGGRAGTHDYKPNGTTVPFAVLNVLDSAIIGRNGRRPPASGVIRFLNDIDAQIPKRPAIDAIIVLQDVLSRGDAMTK